MSPSFLCRAGSLLICILWLSPAQALPSFARQTGFACTACHVGGFGPELTPQGRSFKLGGYVDSTSDQWKLPVSAMAVGSWAQLSSDPPSVDAASSSTRSRTALDEASIFYAGKVAGPVGAFVQGTWDGIAHHLALDNVDIRAAHTFALDSGDLLVGASLNNNPTVQDPWNTTPAWRFPYVSSPLASGTASALLDGGLEMQVLGLTGYALWKDTWYAEIGGYRSPGAAFLDHVGIDSGETSKISRIAPYLRTGWQKTGERHYVSLGVVAMKASIWEGRDSTVRTDVYRDAGVDASWQTLGNPRDVFTLNASYIHESQDRRSELDAGEALRSRHALDTWRLTQSYFRNQTWGATVSLFGVRGTEDALLYGPYAGGSRTGRPDTRGAMLQLDSTPFGKRESWGAPWSNLRIGLQYTAYDQFNGARRNYDGNGRSASANDLVYLFAWLAL